ncbi:hypothetical protein TIFTF001_010627 [Ficus carica]|uniref:Uncharacterized protein n=1 Tax=Ficus carica TaxID=3494 RepID=A0AA88A8Y4_FICCA|nr:hypothetical protein TIFTF001_010627 [Ficus carica]
MLIVSSPSGLLSALRVPQVSSFFLSILFHIGLLSVACTLRSSRKGMSCLILLIASINVSLSEISFVATTDKI